MIDPRVFGDGFHRNDSICFPYYYGNIILFLYL